MFDIQKVREDFPVLRQIINKKPLVYLDNGATTQKPRCVTDVITDYYLRKNSSIHRGVHFLSSQATVEYEKARETVSQFINAKNKHEVIFTSGTTGSLNMLAFSFGEKYIKEGDEIILSEMEHHANIVPWQLLCERKKAKLKVLPFNDDGELLVDQLEYLITEKTKIISVIHISNVLGTINPIKKIIEIGHSHGIPVCIDTAQSIQHVPIDVQKLDCDFLAFSGHKLYGPTGIGGFYGKEKWLEEMPPYQGGGDMVDEVSFEKTTFNQLPFKFEAGTTNYIGAIAMAEGINYIQGIGLSNIADYEHELLEYGAAKLKEVGGVKIFGNAFARTPIFSFHIENVHPLDTGMIFDKMGIAVRTGTHCAQPIMQHYGVDGMVRASLSFYNTKEEIDYLCTGIEQVKRMFL
ncbi:MAG: cysteine desulfurase [Bacteroidales bacterium]|nr:cysteine desulfurase [Bacteroidales bacterium]MBN2817725.1 cysteine desulfurase [Bacteroidales bacterium]